MKAKTRAYEYRFVANEPSTSSSDVYEVKIRVDNRIEDALVRVRSVVLSCNCKGWIFSQSDPKSCTHTREHAGALRRFIADEERRIRIEIGDETEPWLPDLRARYGMPETARVAVRDFNTRWLLRWRDGEKDALAVVRDEDELARARRALKRPGESNFTPFDAEEWLEAHPLQPKRLPWAPGLAGAIYAYESATENDGWANAVMDFAWLKVEADGTPATDDPPIDFGRVPKALEARRARFEALLGNLPPDKPVAVKWRVPGYKHHRALTPIEFAARIGLGGEDQYRFERLVRLCGALVHWPSGGVFVALREGGCPYRLFDYLIDYQPIAAFSLDTGRSRVHFLPDFEPRDRPPDDIWRQAHDNHFQNLVHVAVDDETGLCLRACLDRGNEAVQNDDASPEVMAVFAVAAQFLLNAGWPGEAEMIASDRPWPFGQSQLFSLPIGQLAFYLPSESAPETWEITGRGRLLFQSLLPLEAFAAGRGTPTLRATEIAERCVAAAKAACPALPPTPEFCRRGASSRRELRDWMCEARLRVARETEALGPASAQIIEEISC